jgi:hypothetical protein
MINLKTKKQDGRLAKINFIKMKERERHLPDYFYS